MKCEEIREQLIETARGRELSSDLRAIVFDHAAGCAGCALRLDNERQLTAALAQLAVQAQRAPARIESQILRKLPVVAIKGVAINQRRQPLIWAGAGALAASILVGALLVHPLTPPRPTLQNEASFTDADSADFVPLPYAEAIAPDEATETVRVQLARESLQAMGVPVSENRLGDDVQADLLLGMDGTPRAIRISNEPTYPSQGETNE